MPDPALPANPLWYRCARCGMGDPKVQAAAAEFQACPWCHRYAVMSAAEAKDFLPKTIIAPTTFLPLGPSAYDEQVPEMDGDPLRWPLEYPDRRMT